MSPQGKKCIQFVTYQSEAKTKKNNKIHKAHSLFVSGIRIHTTLSLL